MKRVVMKVITIVLGVLTFVFMFMFLKRVSLPYNSSGVFLDEVDSAVYHLYTTESLGKLVFLLLLFTLIMAYVTTKISCANKSSFQKK